MKAKFEATVDQTRKTVRPLVFKPQEIYNSVPTSPPTRRALRCARLALHRGVGYKGTLHVKENDTGPDDCNHAQFGAFILAAPNVPALGELRARLLDVAPTLWKLPAMMSPIPSREVALRGSSRSERAKRPDV